MSFDSLLNKEEEEEEGRSVRERWIGSGSLRTYEIFKLRATPLHAT